MSREFWIQIENGEPVEVSDEYINSCDRGDQILVREVDPSEPDYKARCEKLEAALSELVEAFGKIHTYGALSIDMTKFDRAIRDAKAALKESE